MPWDHVNKKSRVRGEMVRNYPPPPPNKTVVARNPPVVGFNHIPTLSEVTFWPCASMPVIVRLSGCPSFFENDTFFVGKHTLAVQ